MLNNVIQASTAAPLPPPSSTALAVATQTNAVPVARSIQWEYRILLITIAVHIGAGLLFIGTTLSDKWALIELHHLENVTHVSTGIWRGCSVEQGEHCSLGDLLDAGRNRPYHSDSQLFHIWRSQLAFVFILLGLMGLSSLFSFYTLKHCPRYTLKRLCGALHLMTVLSGIVLMQVFVNGLSMEIHDVPKAHMSMGPCYYLTVIVLCVCAGAGVIFFYFSRKRFVRRGGAGGQKLVDPLDEPLHLGRVS